MLKAYKYRIYPTENQRQQIEQKFGCCRLVYNTALELKMYVWKAFGVSLSAYDLMKQLADAKQDYDYLRHVDSQSLNAVILQMDTAYKGFFAGGGYPKFRKKQGHASFSAPCNKREVDFEVSTLTIPKLPDIKCVFSSRFEGKIKTVTISRTPTRKYFASILVDDGLKVPKKQPISASKTLGIDLGLKDFLITSDGEKVANPRFYREAQTRLKVLQRRVSRKKKASANCKKALFRLAIHHEKTTNKRKDFLQKLSTKFVSENQATSFCVEDLGVKNMSKRAKKKLNESGVAQPNGQAAKSGLNKSIRDAGWSEFVRMLAYKCEWAGKNLIKIGRFEPSSKTCNACKTVNETLTLKDRSWTCEACGAKHDRDINAAKNIRDIGIKNSRRGTSGGPVELRTKVRAKKQEYKKSALI